MEADVQRVAHKIMGVLSLIISVAFMLLMLAAVLSHFGFNVPYVHTLNATEFAYLAGAWWLIRK